MFHSNRSNLQNIEPLTDDSKIQHSLIKTTIPLLLTDADEYKWEGGGFNQTEYSNTLYQTTERNAF